MSHHDLDLRARTDPRRQGDPDRGHVEQPGLAEFPDLPTFKDQGYDDLTAVVGFALSGPGRAARRCHVQAQSAVAKMLEEPTCANAWSVTRSRRGAMTSGEFTQFVASDIAKWAPIAKRVMKAN